MRLVDATYTGSELAAAVGGRLVAGPTDRRLGPVSIDSRSLVTGDVFFALVATRDGHVFVPQALARGAAGLVVDRAVPAPPVTDTVVVEVRDTTRALQDLGRAVRRASGARVVAITGSAGKTTTKDAIALVLEARYRVVKNRGNLNNHWGLPISLVETRVRPDVAVMELGMNHAGEIRELVGIAEPDVRVWTNVGDAHIGHFGTRDAIADAKAEILEGASAATVLVCNADDPLVMARVRSFPGRCVTFGLGEGADVRAVDVRERGVAGTDASVRTSAGTFELTLSLPGRGHLQNALAAAAVGLEFGIPTKTIGERLAELRPAAHRGATLMTPSGATILDDSYNASPAALARTLDAVAASRPSGRRMAVLGEMLELGERSLELHEAAGRHVASAGLDRLITVGGPSAARLGASAVAAGVPAARVSHVESVEAAAEMIAREIQPGDLVLVKGSRGIATDRVVSRLMAGAA